LGSEICGKRDKAKICVGLQKVNGSSSHLRIFVIEVSLEKPRFTQLMCVLSFDVRQKRRAALERGWAASVLIFIENFERKMCDFPQSVEGA
jgi:hypothetical protein